MTTIKSIANTTYIKESTRTTPYVYLDETSGKVIIKGKSSPENAIEFYEPILNKVDGLTQSIELEIALWFFNTSSTKCLFNLIKKLEHKQSNQRVMIKWLVEEDDIDMLEAAEDFQELLSIPIMVVEN